MSITKYKNAQSIALTVALMLATSSMLTGCSSNATPEKMTGVQVVDNNKVVTTTENASFSQTGNLEDLTLDDLYVKSNGNYMPYREYAEVNDIDANTSFYYQELNTGNYKEWTPKLEDWNYLMDLDEEDGSDVYVQESSGSVIPYFMWWHVMSSTQRSSVAWNNVNFVTPAADGTYATYKPSSAELSQIKDGKFVGKTPSRPAVKASSVTGNGTVSSLSKSAGGVTKKSVTTTTAKPATTTTTSTTKSTTNSSTTSTSTSSGTTGKSTTVSTPSTSTSTSGNTTTFGGSTTRSGGGSTSTGG